MWLGGINLQTTCIDTRVKATIVSAMYDMSRIAADGYFDEQDSEEFDLVCKYLKIIYESNLSQKELANRI